VHPTPDPGTEDVVDAMNACKDVFVEHRGNRTGRRGGDHGSRRGRSRPVVTRRAFDGLPGGGSGVRLVSTGQESAMLSRARPACSATTSAARGATIARFGYEPLIGTGTVSSAPFDGGLPGLGRTRRNSRSTGRVRAVADACLLLRRAAHDLPVAQLTPYRAWASAETRCESSAWRGWFPETMPHRSGRGDARCRLLRRVPDRRPSTISGYRWRD